MGAAGQRRLQVKPQNPMAIAGLLISLVGGSVGIWKGAVSGFEYLADQRMARLLTLERLNRLEMQVCELSGREWRAGECTSTEEAPR